MIVIFTLIAIFCAGVIALCIGLEKMQIEHHREIGRLKLMIAQLAAVNDDQLALLRLSDEIRTTLNAALRIIDQELFAIQYELIDAVLKSRPAD